jgi:hypothetical protein
MKTSSSAAAFIRNFTNYNSHRERGAALFDGSAAFTPLHRPATESTAIFCPIFVSRVEAA